MKKEVKNAWIHVRVSPRLRRLAQAQARDNGENLSRLVVKLLEEKIQDEPKTATHAAA
jgi:predicted HicB family RNase H-like nuclease